MTDPTPRDADRPRTGAWILLFGALTACAGQGLFLAAAMTRDGKLPYLKDALGISYAAAIGWFVSCIPLALLVFLFRGSLLRARRLGLASTLAALLGVAAMGFYVTMMILTP